MQKLSIHTPNDYKISAHHFEARKSKGKTFVISGGVGLPQRFFFNFATWLSQQGFHTYTFDYRGIALSKPKTLKGMGTSYRDWTQNDFNSLTEYVRHKHPEDSLYHIGHSFGGNSLGMSTAYRHYEKFMTVGSQFGYYGNFPLSMQTVISLGFGIIAPALSSVLGYFPSHWLGLGEALPKQVALDWGTLLLHKRSMLALADRYGSNHYEKLTQPMLIISLDDDTFAPKKAVDVLATNVFVNAKTERLHLVPKTYGLKQIGHNDFFRKKHRETLWPIVTDWFNL
ncbi:alpha/beta fold hydrolase [Flavobacteriaceae bacterium TP-CH-4]|uniref:Alpha/beta fold hydrolase n=1 Tax=Pelagihabitans pacificus TaxID=2696054 RepID=A0A967ASN7_9FLAO|nr:alpha/beta fold hydrolase [Pelagihabitans pacificus]NHF59242.1 alpha/beta fold hydrolase [Pelagihabitans pacificus]